MLRDTKLRQMVVSVWWIVANVSRRKASHFWCVWWQAGIINLERRIKRRQSKISMLCHHSQNGGWKKIGASREVAPANLPNARRLGCHFPLMRRENWLLMATFNPAWKRPSRTWIFIFFLIKKTLLAGTIPFAGRKCWTSLPRRAWYSGRNHENFKGPGGCPVRFVITFRCR